MLDHVSVCVFVCVLVWFGLSVCAASLKCLICVFLFVRLLVMLNLIVCICGCRVGGLELAFVGSWFVCV